MEVVVFLLVLYILLALLVRFFCFISGKPKRDAAKAELISIRKDLLKEKEDFYKSKDSFENERKRYEKDRQDLNELVRKKAVLLAQNISSRPYLQATPAFQAIAQCDASTYDRLHAGLNSSFSISSPFDISAHIISSDGSEYITTLYSCSCPDCQIRKRVCKHMLRLAVETGLLFHESGFSPLKNEVSALLEQRKDLLAEKDSLSREKDRLSQKEKRIQKIMDETSQRFPWVAKLYSDCCEALEIKYTDYLKIKPHPSHSTAKRMEQTIKQDLAFWRRRAKEYEYQLNFYESIFPWLTEFKEVPPVEAFQYTQNAQSAQVDDLELFREYLSPEEYQTLSDTERSQLALERYISRKKSPWEVGIEYERYIGFLCEQKGYAVTYFGATAEKTDMGRDLILEKEETIILIQCKRWAREKTIHENHIFQLAGSTYEYQYSHPEKKVIGVFVTTIDFSPVAVRCAELLKIRLFPNVPFREYPRIKCNIRKAERGEIQKIYHLPMDQQYDRVKISQPGECYAHTASEAESLGFRRAYRWHNPI